MELARAIELTGGLSSPSKMPSYSYNLPASACPTGRIMRGVPGSVCSDCYACKGRYVFPNVRKALQRRLDSVYHDEWADAMVHLIRAKSDIPYFRFHDSGDLMDYRHLEKILKIVTELPEMKFWLPTLEADLVKWYFVEEGNRIPENLNIRISSPMINTEPYPFIKEIREQRIGITTSSVFKDQERCNIHDICPAIRFKTGNCGHCRKCWDRSVGHVVYLKH